MKESKYKSFDDLPLFLNAALVAEVLGTRRPLHMSSCTRTGSLR